MERPDLTNLPAEINEYILYLESELERYRGRDKRILSTDDKTILEPSEPPTSLNLVTISAAGFTKRTPRHLYGRQRRAGMGIFDLEVPDQDYPAILAIADETQSLILFTNQARAFRLPVSKLNEAAIRSRGESIPDRFPLEPGEHFVAALPDQASGYIALVSQRGMIRSLRHHLFGEYLRPGTAFYNYREFGPLAAASWTPGNADLLIASRQGMAIRFAEKLIPPAGVLAIRLDPDDQVVSVTPVDQESGVFLIAADGKGTIRLMSAFNPNKSPGGSGKIALKTECLISAMTIHPEDDIFIITRLAKLIRFRADEVPTTEGVIQGVQCINLRADEVSAITPGRVK